jgi:hypothetical protein
MVARNVQIVIYVIGIVVLLPVLIAAAVDLSLEGRQSSLGQHLARWSRRYPLFAAGLILLLGVSLSHFFWQT